MGFDKQTLDISSFQHGIISRADAQDIPITAATDSNNIDGDSFEGKLQAIPTFGADKAKGSCFDAKRSTWIKGADDKYNLVYVTGAGTGSDIIKLAQDFYATTPTLSSMVSNTPAYSFTPFRQGCYIGCGVSNDAKWVGYLNFTQLGSGAAGWFTANAKIPRPAASTGDAWVSAKSPHFPPKVTFTLPYNGGGGNGITVITITFDKDILDASVVVGSTIFLTDLATSLPVTCTKSVSGKSIFLTITGTLPEGYYNVRMVGGTGTVIKSSAGIEMKADYNFVFQESGSGIVPDFNAFTIPTNTGHEIETHSFNEKFRYQYGMSMVYSYLEESPIGSTIQTYSPAVDGNSDYVALTVSLNSNSLDRRVTGCKLYRKDINIDEPTQESSWVLLESFDITTATGWGSPSAGIYTRTYNDDNGTTNTIFYGTYEQETGMAETLLSTDVNYTFSTSSNNRLFVAKCAKAEVSQAASMLFRSKEFRYGMFDWDKDYINLSTIPTAMVTFNNRIWVFDDNRAYTINPDNMNIEQVSEGSGCLSQRSVAITDYGMFWCNHSNVYWHNGQTIIPIGDAIKGQTSWHSFTQQYTTNTDKQDKTPIVLFTPAKNYVLFIIPNDVGNVANVWAYHVAKKRWDKWESFSTECGTSFGAFVGRDGEVYIATGGTKLYNAFEGTSTRSWTWTSRDINFDSSGQYKKFYKLYMAKTGTVTATYGLDGATPNNAFTGDNYANGVWPKNKSTQIKLAGNADSSVNSMQIVYRPMEGNR